MRRSVSDTRSLHGSLSKYDRLLGHRQLVTPTAPRNILNSVAVAITSRKILFGVYPHGVLAENLFDDTERFDVVAPVRRRQKAQAADAVGHGYLVGGGPSCGHLG